MPATTPRPPSSEQVAAFDRNAWPRSIGIPGRNRRNPHAQRFEDLFPFFQQRGRRSWFDPPEREAPPPDFSKAPAPKKTDPVPQSPIMVFGDSMADWLAYGLEQAFTDNPEIGGSVAARTTRGQLCCGQ
jgi:hypothetical protein